MDFKCFVHEFISNLTIPLTYIEKHPNVENTLQFAAKFAISLQPQSENEEEYEEMCAFLEQIFDFLLTHHDAKDMAVMCFSIFYYASFINLIYLHT
jgi:condensin complex subunit 3